MVIAKTLKVLEYDKILASVSAEAVLERSKREISESVPSSDIKEVEFLLKKTEEAYKYLFTYSVPNVYFFSDVTESLDVAKKGGTLSIGEILRVNANLKSARIMKEGVLAVNDEGLTLLKGICAGLYTDEKFEKDIERIIISEDEISDDASPKLYQIRKAIRNLNQRIKDKLNSFMRGSYAKYLTDCIVTMRQDRYVVPVKSEYRSQIKGFIHDQSASKSTVFIEPEEVMELNNELKRTLIEEQDEINRILRELTGRIAGIEGFIRYNYDNLVDVDTAFAKASYSYKNKCSLPKINDKGIIEIFGGRHPLIDKDKVRPIDVTLGEDYKFLLITGPNTGGKTVTMKLVGLLSLMVMSGIFVPCKDNSQVSIFDNVFCDIGDEQSIEQSLSTFSSHMYNIKNILDGINDKTLVLLDELGGGTDPDEGSALALAIIEKLLSTGAVGIITTHYSRLKEYAEENGNIKNASMEFDAVSMRPVYKLNIGIPGSSNAIEIAKTLGLDKDIINKSLGYVSESRVSFDRVLKKAEETRREYQRLLDEEKSIVDKKRSELQVIEKEKEKITAEKEKIATTSRQEIKAIVSDRVEEAEEIIAELKEILKQAELDSRAVFKANELKTRLKNSQYSDTADNTPIELNTVDISQLKVGDKVFVKSLGTFAIVEKINVSKKKLEVRIGDARSTVNIKDVFNREKTEPKKITVKKSTVYNPNALREINVIGKTSLEALTEVQNFIDQAVVNRLEEVKIIHGVGQGVLIKAIRDYLKKDKNVSEFRRGIYGEGENGVTIVKLK